MVLSSFGPLLGYFADAMAQAAPIHRYLDIIDGKIEPVHGDGVARGIPTQITGGFYRPLARLLYR